MALDGGRRRRGFSLAAGHPAIGVVHFPPVDQLEQAGTLVVNDEADAIGGLLGKRTVDLAGQALDACGPGAALREVKEVVDI